MDILKRTALLTALKTGSITAAAEKLGYTQSGLSYTISTLEAEVGFPLLHRSRSGVRPTSECLRLLPLMQDLERRDAQLEQEIAELRGVLTGTLTLATFQSVSRFFLPKLLRAFTEQYPNVSINLQEESRETCIQMVRSGEADLGMFSHYPQDPFEWVDFYSDEIMVVLPEEHPLAAKEALTFDDLADQPFVLDSAQLQYNYDVRHLMEQAGFQPPIRFSSKEEIVILEMIREKLGISIMAKLYLDPLPSGLVARSLSPRAFRHLGIACASQSELSPAARRFLELARRTLVDPSTKM